MFVGRVIPNKRFERRDPRVPRYRTRHNPRSRLLLVGSYSGFERYLAMLQALIARLGTPDVHFLGHVSNEELTALYDVADLFLCASEHEGFCVPMIEAFYKRVPVLAYAATAVPATMDGGGVLYDTKDPIEIARLMDAVLDDADSRRRCIASQDAALDRCSGAGFRRHAAAVRRRRSCAAPPRPAPEVPSTSGRSSISSSARRAAPVQAGAVQALPSRRRGRRGQRRREEPGSRDLGLDPSPEPAMIINQWVPAAHRGDAIGDSARASARCCARRAHQSDLYALTIDDDLRGDVRPFADPAATRGDVTIFHFALPSPMTERSPRSTAARPAVPQHHAGAVLRPARSPACSAGRARTAGAASLVGHVDLALGDSEFNRQELEALGFAPTGVLPIAVDTERITDAPRRPALEKILGDGLINILFVGRIVPNKRIEDHIRLAEHYKRYVDSYYRFIFVGRYDGVPRYYAQVRALIVSTGCCRIGSGSPARCPTTTWPRTTAGRTPTSR